MACPSITTRAQLRKCLPGRYGQGNRFAVFLLCSTAHQHHKITTAGASPRAYRSKNGIFTKFNYDSLPPQRSSSPSASVSEPPPSSPRTPIALAPSARGGDDGPRRTFFLPLRRLSLSVDGKMCRFSLFPEGIVVSLHKIYEIPVNWYLFNP